MEVVHLCWAAHIAACACFVAVVAGGCSEQTGETDGGDDPKSNKPAIVDPPASCLADAPCQTDNDCAPLGGYRCNLAMSPPECEQLYCGPANTRCSSSEMCEQGLQCYEGGCNPCNTCGNLCEVDFDTDPAHCGGCDRPVPQGLYCVDGNPGCPAGMTDCDGRCVDLTSDPMHCGQCFNALPSGVECKDGVPGCTSPLVPCTDSCVDLSTSQNNCGECGSVCPPSSSELLECDVTGHICDMAQCGCNNGSCRAYLISYQQITCNDLCGQHGLACDNATWAYGGGGWECPSGSCSQVPSDVDPNYNAYAFFAIRCRCSS